MKKAEKTSFLRTPRILKARQNRDCEKCAVMEGEKHGCFQGRRQSSSGPGAREEISRQSNEKKQDGMRHEL